MFDINHIHKARGFWGWIGLAVFVLIMAVPVGLLVWYGLIEFDIWFWNGVNWCGAALHAIAVWEP